MEFCSSIVSISREVKNSISLNLEGNGISSPWHYYLLHYMIKIIWCGMLYTMCILVTTEVCTRGHWLHFQISICVGIAGQAVKSCNYVI